jgi:AcrR family transcriptional regulator
MRFSQGSGNFHTHLKVSRWDRKDVDKVTDYLDLVSKFCRLNRCTKCLYMRTINSMDMLVKTPDRQQAILLAAEKLFAEKGYARVTIREIAREANVPLALVGYYYGPKHELFQAIFEHWKGTIDERLAQLRAATAKGIHESSLQRIVEAFVDPVLKMRASAEGEYYALLVARELYHSTPEADKVLRNYFDPLAHAFIDAIHLVFAHASRAQVSWCYQFSLGALLHHLSDARIERLSKSQAKLGDPEARHLLVQFIVGGIHAALPTSSKAIKTRRHG